MLQDFLVDLGGIYVHTTRNDDFGATAREEQKSVFVDKAHVPHRVEVATIGAVGFLRCLEIFEAALFGCLEVDCANRVRLNRLALIIMNFNDHAGQRFADRAFLREPLLSLDEYAAALRRGIIFEDDGTEPGNRILLHMRRAGRRAMQNPAQRRGVVFCLGLIGKLQHAVQHGGDDMGVRDAVIRNKTQCLLRIPSVHQHAADAGIHWKAQVQRERRSVIKRSRH